MKSHEVPEGWEEIEIGKTGHVITGKTPSTANENFWDGEVPFVTPTDITDDRIQKDTERKVTRKGLKESTKLPPGTLMVTCIASIGKNAITKSICCTNQQINSVIAYSKFDVNFLYYSVELIKSKLESIAGQTAVPIIKKSQFEKIILVIPKSLKEQQKIASFLLTIDKAIEKTKALIEKNKKIRQGLMHDLLCPKEKLQNWIEKRLVEIAGIIVSNVDKKMVSNEKSILLCNYMDVYKNRYLSKKHRFSKGTADENEIRKFSLRENDVIITKDSEVPDDIAVPAVIMEYIEHLVCGYHLAILRPKKEFIDGKLLMNLLRHNMVNRQFSQKANGITRYGLTKGTINEVLINFPSSKNEQLKIVSIILSIDQKIRSDEFYLGKLIKLKSGLMQDLLTGKVMVKVGAA